MKRAFPFRWLRTLNAQLFLWAVLPVTFIVITLAFTGVYSHQKTMLDFVLVRDQDLVQLAVRIIEDGLAQGAVAADGSGLGDRIALVAGNRPGQLLVVNGDGRLLASSGQEPVGNQVADEPGVTEALQQREGFVTVQDGTLGPSLVTFSPVSGTDWEVIIKEPVRGLVGPTLQFGNLGPVVAFSAGILSLLVLTFGWRTIVRPLQRLSGEAEQVSWGDFAAITRPVGGVQEVRDLHRALREMVERIRGYQAGIRDYLGAVTQGQEAERARLARELHDGPLQELIAMGQRAEMIQRLLGRGQGERASALLGELRREEHETVEELRLLIGGLRPVYLEDLGFVPALDMLVKQAAKRTTADIRLEIGQSVRRLPPDVELAAYRIAQEALNNAVEHASARTITVRAQFLPEELVLSVMDDGVGFVLPERPDRLTQAGHFGLMGMRERAALLGGVLRIHAAPGKGTEIIVRLPDQPVLL